MRTPPPILVWHRRADEYREALRARIPGADIEAVGDVDPAAIEVAGGWPGVPVLLGWRLPDGALRLLPELEWIHATGAGVDHLLQRPDLSRKVRISRSLGRFGAQVAEYTVGYLLHRLLCIDAYRAQQRRRRWQQHGRPLLADRTLGIVGLGSLGSAIARRVAAFGATVIGVRRNAVPHPGVARVVAAADWLDVLPECEVLVLAAPLTPETRAMVDADALSRLPRGAVLVNVARGELVDETALVAALRDGHLGGAVLDVFQEEPLAADHPLWTAENAWITPHIAAPSEIDSIAEEFVENWRRWLAGKPLRNEVDRQRGY